MFDRCFIIAEVAQAHEGSLGIAHSYIDSIAESGADAVKFQTHIAEFESSIDEPFRIGVKYGQDKNRFDYWKRMEFSYYEWKGLKSHCDDVGLEFMSSPFSIEAVEMLADIGMTYWKVGSGEISNWPMIATIAQKFDPIMISTGMSCYDEIDEVVSLVAQYHKNIALLQCTSSYPCSPKSIGLNVIGELMDRYGLSAGLSDHSGTIYPALSAVSLGAKIVEVHTIFNKKMFGFDARSSVDFSNLELLVNGVRMIEEMIDHPVDKGKNNHETLKNKPIFQKSIIARNDIKAGSKVTEKDLMYLKPAIGISPKEWNNVVGMYAISDIKKGAVITYEALSSET